MKEAKLLGWTYHNYGPNCDKATRLRLDVLLVPACKGRDAQLFRCAEVIRKAASNLRAERLAKAKG